MDAITQSVIFNGAAPLYVGGARYEVRPLPLREIIDGAFAASGLYCPDDNEPPGNWQAIRLEAEPYRQALDGWLHRLLTLGGEPQGLDAIGHWTDADLGRFLSLALQASGLTRTSKDGNTTRTEPEDWLDIVSELQYRAHMAWDDLLDMPLLRLNAIRERILKQAANDVNNSAAGLLGTVTGGRAAQPTKDPRFGETPQFDSREDYFNFVNKHI